jgi:hypothetical protein
MTFRHLLVLGGMLLLADVASAQTARRQFAEIPWGSNATVVKAGMLRMDLTFREQDETGDLRFDGLLAGHKAIVYALMNAQDQLTKVQVSVVTEDHQAIRVWEAISGELSERYGKPTLGGRYFSAPFHEGDGDEEQAVRDGKATLTYLWGKDPVGISADDASVITTVTEALNVQIVYESGRWPADSRRRRSGAVKIF